MSNYNKVTVKDVNTKLIKILGNNINVIRMNKVDPSNIEFIKLMGARVPLGADEVANLELPEALPWAISLKILYWKSGESLKKIHLINLK